ncbi:Ethanolamine utilization protein [Nocardia cyriacigeorgica]|uniref:Ethanolamine utilization protein n=2 Tax=Nocardia cyriacigeorgica TaxID=135487 RepID=A0A4U8W4Z3_9NOCA|nr:Ethanolamine utilization protein [Nocardia cyriacigeorgica]
MSAPDEQDSGMNEIVCRIRCFTHRDVRSWEQVADGIRIGAALTADYGRMSAGFTRMAAGARAPLAAPYEEVWMLTAGTMTIDSADGVASARQGDLIHLHPASRGELSVTRDLEMLALAFPPAWEIELEAWEAAREQSAAGPFARVISHPEVSGSWQSEDRRPFITTAERAGRHFAMGFGRAGAGGAHDAFAVPGDQVMLATAGRCHIRTGTHGAAGGDGRAITIRQGEFAYLPAGSSGTLSAEPGSEITWAHLHPFP